MRSQKFESESEAIAALTDEGFFFVGHLHDDSDEPLLLQVTAWLPNHGMRRRWPDGTNARSRVELAPQKDGSWVVRHLDPED